MQLFKLGHTRLKDHMFAVVSLISSDVIVCEVKGGHNKRKTKHIFNNINKAKA